MLQECFSLSGGVISFFLPLFPRLKVHLVGARLSALMSKLLSVCGGGICMYADVKGCGGGAVGALRKWGVSMRWLVPMPPHPPRHSAAHIVHV